MFSQQLRNLAAWCGLCFLALSSQAQTSVGATADANLAALKIPSVSFSGQYYSVTFNLLGYYEGNPVYQLGPFAASAAPGNGCTAPTVASDLSVSIPYGLIGTTPRAIKLTFVSSNNVWIGTSTAVSGGTGAPNASDPLTQLLVSSPAWCYFSFSASSGVSKNYRFAFHPSGSLLVGGNADTYFDTATGSYSSAGSTGAVVLRWFAIGQILTLTSAAGSSELIVNVSLNSNGSPILNVAGSELSRCQ
ncbi:MAG: hypothetical protein CFE43_08810 [Burkholderiales bacterium PBB3]|nr:MAG: hypothetical protein CFE43_08810 [Burkholderiales bacterium PBB3]